MAALRHAARRLAGRATPALFHGDGAAAVARPRSMLFTSSRSKHPSLDDYVDSRVAQMHKTKEELYNLVAEFQRNAKTDTNYFHDRKTRRLNRQLLVDLAQHVKPRIGDNDWILNNIRSSHHGFKDGMWQLTMIGFLRYCFWRAYIVGKKS